MDRNIDSDENGMIEIQSLSARRAWIEIPSKTRSSTNGEVALRKESVDRNGTVITSLS